jgi:cytochrome c-type biogenesis protein CcmH
MGWTLICGLALICAGLLVLLGRIPRSTWEMLGAALLLGVAGYVWQGSPGLAGSPRDARAQSTSFDEALARQRMSLSQPYTKAGQWLTMSDGMARQGDTQNAANVLISGLRANPRDPDLWVGMGNALVNHAGGMLTPSAEYSYRRAMQLAPEGYGAPYFFGLALARSGQLEGARKLWVPLARRVPASMDLSVQLRSDLAQVERLLAQTSMP